MREVEIKARITVFENEGELSPEDRELLQLAREAARRAYAAYSHFQVGAAILLENGITVTGNNQENAVYPSGMCAERTTAYYASARFPGVPFRKIAVTALNPDERLTKPVPPCGACRQSLQEYETRFGQPIRVLMAGEEGEIWMADSVADLLPLTFSSDFLPQ